MNLIALAGNQIWYPPASAFMGKYLNHIAITGHVNWYTPGLISPGEVLKLLKK